MKRTYLYFISTFLLISILLPTQSFAHNGKKDELGGHFRSSDCAYLLHSPTELARSAKNMNELIALIKANNTNEKCKALLSPDTVDLEGYSFPSSTPKETPASTTPAPKPSAALEMGKTYTATLEKCTDGDTANFNINGTIYKTRFLYIDTPESTTQKEPFGKEASEYTCNFLKQGTIKLETDGGDLFDKYDRLLAWVFVDGKLHQEEITKAGFVEDFYDYGTYKYEDRVIAAMSFAKTNYTGMYEINKPVATTTKESTTESNTSTEDDTIEEDNKDGTEVVSKDTTETDKTDNSTSTVKESTNAETATETKVTEKVLATDELVEETEVGNGYIITGLIVAMFYFMLPRIKLGMGVQPVLAHKLSFKKWWINFILLGVYIALWWLLLIVIVIELIHLAKSRKQSVA
ncbi:thermonuclease family protein [Cytobacillus luteolus]|uniref:thermonuclease family protein n=1 Tax=Litchfieldia luteola TaxID=682179 RepID=UPI001CAE8D56|nr:thermonuclease family protein [Cytobacillus luteolus]MBP1942273.1 endonuclease YncB(thermonuclease family) [Cytobacillus luteolus]